jgi:hypothetical protein
MPRKVHISQIITRAEMRDAIARSGYLLESRLAAHLNRKRWFVDSNQSFLDPDTNVSREIDLYADSSEVHFVSHDPQIYVSVDLAIEAVNNMQPAVFFEGGTSMSTELIDLIRFSCTPALTRERDHFTDELELEVWHHDDSVKTCSQYCTFKRKTSGQHGEWMAHHPDDFHETIRKLALFTEHKKAERDQTFSETEDEAIRLILIQPIIVLGGSLYLAIPLTRSVALKAISKIVFEYSYHFKQQPRTLTIDVVGEPHFKNHVLKLEEQARQLGHSILVAVAGKIVR